MSEILPDVLRPKLKLVFCGTAASKRSAQDKAYYAHPGNLFWKTLFTMGFIPEPLQAAQFHVLPEYGIGLTDLNKSQSGVDAVLDKQYFDCTGLREKIQQYQPQILAFTSKHAAMSFYQIKKLVYGEIAQPVFNTRIWVLPSTSGNARPHWQKLQHHWQDLSKIINTL